MQHPIGDHALLANGRTAALVSSSGNVAWLCWPRIDSLPCLFELLDEQLGGEFSLRPTDPTAVVIDRTYEPGSLILNTTWQAGDSTVHVSEGLTWGEPSRLVRIAHSDGTGVMMRARFRPAFEAGRTPVQMAVHGSAVRAHGGDAGLTLAGPAGPVTWELRDDCHATSMTAPTAQCDILVGSAAPIALVLSATADTDGTDADGTDADGAVAATLLDTTRDAWAATSARVGFAISPLAERTLGNETTRALVATSASVLIGLTQRDGGIVAAPTTSIPQWPGSSRTWDYRYSWLRDTALAGIALLQIGLIPEAADLGAFIGRAVGDGKAPRALLRVDGSDPPAETTLPDLTGHGGARPVRIGNAAADQPQLDVIGEVIEFAWSLYAHGALPPELGHACVRLADWTADHWREPDHGIWEIRGAPHCYNHSRLMAWTGLRKAVLLAAAGAGAGAIERWRTATQEIGEALLRDATPAIELHEDGGGPDAGLALLPLLGLLTPDDERVRATLALIRTRLSRHGLIERYAGQPDDIPDPCAPFLFPTFWIAMACEACGIDGSEHFSAATRARSSLGLFGEVAHPDDGSPLGNYPQVQSHAAFILAATTATASPASPRQSASWPARPRNRA